MNSTNHQASSGIAAHPERREYPRFTTHVQIELRQENNDVPLRTETTDLSRGGCYIQMIMTLPVGAYVNATLWLGDTPVHVRGRVVTRHPQFGNGIIFIEFQDGGEQLLARYLGTLSA